MQNTCFRRRLRMTIERRQEIYSAIFRFMLDNEINSIPFRPLSLCNSLNIKTVPLSKMVEDTGIPEENIFYIWGNQDGVINYYNGEHKISYNDTVTDGRIRFTFGEELSHMILGHTLNPEFNMFSQNYCPEIYEQYEEEARIGSGLFMCHPKFFYCHQQALTPNNLALVCGLTTPCAKVRYDVLTRFKREITSNAVYSLLPVPSLTPVYQYAI